MNFVAVSLEYSTSLHFSEKERQDLIHSVFSRVTTHIPLEEFNSIPGPNQSSSEMRLFLFYPHKFTSIMQTGLDQFLGIFCLGDLAIC